MKISKKKHVQFFSLFSTDFKKKSHHYILAFLTGGGGGTKRWLRGFYQKYQFNGFTDMNSFDIKQQG